MYSFRHRVVLGIAGVMLLTASAYACAFKVAILPNELFQKGVEKVSTLESVNKHDVNFAIFTGDTKDGKSECSDAVIVDGLKNYFQKLNVPTLYSVGDNEWTDCHRISNGSYDPLERLSRIRKSFFTKETTQGACPLDLHHEVLHL